MKTSFIVMACLASSTILFSGCSSEKTEIASGSTIFDEDKYTTFFSNGDAITRADHIRDHSVGTTALPYWEPGDEVWLYMGPTWRIRSLGSNITTETKTAKFYFQSGLNEPSYHVHYLGAPGNDGIHVTIPAQQNDLLPNASGHLAQHGDCGEATAVRNPNKAGIYSMTFKRLPAYLCVLPYNTSRPNAQWGESVVQKIVVESDNIITGTYDVGQFGLDPAHATNTGKRIECTVKAGSIFTIYDRFQLWANAVYIAIPPGWHRLTFYVYFKSPTQGDIFVMRTANSREYKANTMSDVKIDLADYRTASNNPIVNSGVLDLAKKHRAIEVTSDEDWNGMFND